MRRFASFVLVAPPALALAGACGAPNRHQVAVTHVAVVDVVTGRIRPDQTILIAGGLIRVVGPAKRLRLPAGTRVVDGRGRWAIPGLWDMHAHIDDTGDWSFPLMVAAGVTGVRDMGGGLEWLARWRERVGRDSLIPRIVAAGPIVTGLVADPDSLRVVRVSDSAAAVRAVDTLARRGIDFVKVHDWLTPEQYAGVAAAARSRGLAFAGHLPAGVSLGDAVRHGQRSIEHLGNARGGLLVECSADPARRRRVMTARITAPFEAEALVGGFPPAELDALGRSCTEARADSLARLIAHAGIWQTPVLYSTYRLALLPLDGSFAEDPRLAYLPDTVRDLLDPILAEARRPPARDHAAARRRLYERQQALVRTLHRRGVGFLAGTDAFPYPLVFPGFTLHDELTELVRAGLPPLTALQAATLNPARYFGAADTLGTVAPGRVADIVILDGDPLRDIRNVARIHAVVIRGAVLDSAGRTRLLRSRSRP